MIDRDEGALSTLLRKASGDAVRVVLTPEFQTIVSRARRRRAGRRVAATASALVAFVALGAGIRAAVPEPTPVPPVVLAPELDPVMKPMLTVVPVLVYAPTPGVGPDPDIVRDTIFRAMPGDRDLSQYDDVRELFPDAPMSWPALTSDQSATTAQFQQAATGLRKLPGVKDAQVLTRPGMWFTMTAVARDPKIKDGNLDTTGLPSTINGWAGSSVRVGDKSLWSIRLTYCGPAIDRAAYELIRTRVAQSVGTDAAAVTLKMESMS